MNAPFRAGAPRYDYLIVGAGFAGSVLAERLASQHGARVLLIDRRPHVGGNAYDEPNEAGILYHKYGPHIFHTNSDQVVDYLSQFTEWRPYEHRVLAQVRGQLVPIPINRTTLNKLFDLDLKTDEEAADYLASRAEPVDDIRTSEDVVINAVGRELYELFFRGYTRKQWGLDPSELDKQVTARIPTRTNTDDRYFTDTFQAMPRDGYTAMFERMLDHPLIEVRTGVDFRDVRDEVDCRPHHLHRPDRRIFRLPLRQAAVPEPEVRSPDARPGAVPARSAVVNYPVRGRALHADQRVQASDRAAVAGDDDHLRISVGRGRSLLSDPAARESGAVQALRGARRRDRGRDLRRAAGDLPLLQHGPDRRPGAGDVPAHG